MRNSDYVIQLVFTIVVLGTILGTTGYATVRLRRRGFSIAGCVAMAVVMGLAWLLVLALAAFLLLATGGPHH